MIGLKDWVIQWLTTYKKIMVKPSTFDSYLYYATHVTCTVEINKLTVFDVQELINNMVCEGCKVSTIKHMLTIVRQSLYKARQIGLIDSLSCMDNLELPRSKAKKINPLPADQVQRIIKNRHLSHYGDFFVALILTGCRVGELIALRWCDVDFFNGVVRIRHTDYNGELQEVKTDAGKRDLPLYDDLLDILYRLKRGKMTDRVFTNTVGKTIKYRTVLDSWNRFCDAIGLYDKPGFHVLRHTFAHRALRAGVPIKVVSAWLGHADIKITLSIYDSIDDEDFKSAAQILSRINKKAII